MKRKPKPIVVWVALNGRTVVDADRSKRLVKLYIKLLNDSYRNGLRLAKFQEVKG